MDILVIFDMDGLIVESEHLHCRAYLEVFHKYGIDMDREEYYRKLSTEGTPISEICDEYGVNTDAARIKREKKDIYLKLIDKEMELFPGVRDCIKRMKDNFRVILATASRRPFVDRIFEKFDLEGYFEFIITGSDVEKRKPHPEIYRKAARKMDFPPSRCLVLEDAQKGVIAAHRAGMKSIAIPTKYTADGDYSSTIRVLENISEVTPELVKDVFQKNI